MTIGIMSQESFFFNRFLAAVQTNSKHDKANRESTFWTRDDAFRGTSNMPLVTVSMGWYRNGQVNSTM